jgi:hypothetical protein
MATTSNNSPSADQAILESVEVTRGFAVAVCRSGGGWRDFGFLTIGAVVGVGGGDLPVQEEVCGCSSRSHRSAASAAVRGNRSPRAGGRRAGWAA